MHHSHLLGFKKTEKTLGHTRRYKEFVVVCLLLTTTLSGYTAESGTVWRWYSASFGVPFGDSDFLVIRRGKAVVAIKGSTVSIKFSEKDFPEARASFFGEVKNDEITGQLKDFFFDGPALRIGRYWRAQISENCIMEEISLRNFIPDGEVLIITRSSDGCWTDRHPPD